MALDAAVLYGDERNHSYLAVALGIMNYSLLQPPRNNKLNLLHKDQARKLINFKVLRLAWKQNKAAPKICRASI